MSTETLKEQKDEFVVHPNHYNIYDVETIEMMAKIWGDNEVAIWAKLNAFKYRMRMGYKKGVDINQDFQKEQECLKIKDEYEKRVNESHLLRKLL